MEGKHKLHPLSVKLVRVKREAHQQERRTCSMSQKKCFHVAVLQRRRVDVQEEETSLSALMSRIFHVSMFPHYTDRSFYVNK